MPGYGLGADGNCTICAHGSYSPLPTASIPKPQCKLLLLKLLG